MSKISFRSTMLINLTPHSITSPMGRLQSSGVARVSATEVEVDNIDGVPIIEASYGEVVGLPEPQDRVLYVVSQMVANAVKRPDCIYPARLLRDAHGQIVGCEAFGRVR